MALFSLYSYSQSMVNDMGGKGEGSVHSSYLNVNKLPGFTRSSAAEMVCLIHNFVQGRARFTRLGWRVCQWCHSSLTTSDVENLSAFNLNFISLSSGLHVEFNLQFSRIKNSQFDHCCHTEVHVKFCGNRFNFVTPISLRCFQPWILKHFKLHEYMAAMYPCIFWI